jgi:hypothetical protein
MNVWKKMGSDLLILAVLAKFFFDLAKGQFVSEWAFIIGSILLSFLLGLSGRLGKMVLKEGISIAILILFIGMLSIQGFVPAYVGFFGTLAIIYLFAKLARFTGRMVLALLVLLIAIYLLYRFFGFK